MRKPKTQAIVRSGEPSPEEWKDRALRAEAECAKYREAFSLLMAPFAHYMRDTIEQQVSEAVDDAVSELQIVR